MLIHQFVLLFYNLHLLTVDSYFIEGIALETENIGSKNQNQTIIMFDSKKTLFYVFHLTEVFKRYSDYSLRNRESRKSFTNKNVRNQFCFVYKAYLNVNIKI